MPSRLIRFALIAVTSVFAGCAVDPPSLRGHFASIDAAGAASGHFSGSEIRWGGIVTGAVALDGGTCLEIAWFPVDRYSAIPYVGSQDRGGLGRVFWNSRRLAAVQAPGDRIGTPEALPGWGGSLPTPRFLACGSLPLPPGQTQVGAVLTVTGTLRAPLVLDVPPGHCREPAGWAYRDNLRRADAAQCVISLPTLTVASAFAWKDPPRFEPFVPSHDHS